MIRIVLCVSVLFTNILFAFPGLGDKKETGIARTPSHIIILQTDAELLWGAYYFAVNNATGEERELSSHIRLPREIIDFQAAEGLTNEDLVISKDGVLNVHKVYPPGLSLQGIQFKVRVNKDSDNVLTLIPVEDIGQLYIATPQSDLLHLKAEGFVEGIPSMLQGASYTGIHAGNKKAGESIVVSISGFPGGRRPFLILGACVGLLLLFSVAFLTLRGRRDEVFEGDGFLS